MADELDTLDYVLIGGVATLAGVGAVLLKRFSVTSMGENPWTLDAAFNVLRLAPHILKVRSAIEGSITSVYRSLEVNEKLSNASKTSRHMEGLAVDCKPGKAFSVEAASRKIAGMARRGELGPVRTVIWEPTWVHVDWFRVGELHTKLATRKAIGSGAATTYQTVEL